MKRCVFVDQGHIPLIAVIIKLLQLGPQIIFHLSQKYFVLFNFLGLFIYDLC